MVRHLSSEKSSVFGSQERTASWTPWAPELVSFKEWKVVESATLNSLTSSKPLTWSCATCCCMESAFKSIFWYCNLGQLMSNSSASSLELKEPLTIVPFARSKSGKKIFKSSRVLRASKLNSNLAFVCKKLRCSPSIGGYKMAKWWVRSSRSVSSANTPSIEKSRMELLKSMLV